MANNPNKLLLFHDEKSPLYWANLTATEDIVVNQGGTFSGKSFAILLVLITIAIMKQNYVITVVSSTVPKLKEDAMRIFEQLLAKYPYARNFIKSYNATERTYVFHTGSIIEFKSFESNVQAEGGKRQILYINELPRIPFGIFWRLQIRTTVRTFVDYNPTATFYIHDKVVNNKDEYPSVKVIRSWHEHNPYLTVKQHERIERIKDPQLHRVYARGLTGMLRGQVYPTWIEVPSFSHAQQTLWYLDFGFSDKQSADPTAGGKIAVKPSEYKDLDFLADELIYSRGIGAAQIAQIFKDNGYKEGQPCYCDHSTEMIRELRMLGIAAFPAAKGPGSVLSGVLFLKQKRIGYTERSENIRMERSKYVFMEVEGILTNTPVDEFNHHMDGIRYAIHTNSLIKFEV